MHSVVWYVVLGIYSSASPYYSQVRRLLSWSGIFQPQRSGGRLLRVLLRIRSTQLMAQRTGWRVLIVTVRQIRVHTSMGQLYLIFKIFAI